MAAFGPPLGQPAAPSKRQPKFCPTDGVHLRNPRDYLNPAAFAQNATGAFGNLGRDAVHRTGRFNINAALARTFALTERFKLEARWEAFNTINHVNYANPATSISSSTFGRITATMSGTARRPEDPAGQP